MLALVLVVGPRVSPVYWKCNKTAGATGICDDHRRVTSQKKKKGQRKEETRGRGDGMGGPAIGG